MKLSYYHTKQTANRLLRFKILEGAVGGVGHITVYEDDNGEPFVELYFTRPAAFEIVDLMNEPYLLDKENKQA